MQKNEWDSLFNLSDNLLQSNLTDFSKHHYIRFINLKIWRIISMNEPSSFHKCLSLADETYHIYKFDEHSKHMITQYGADRGLQSIAVGTVHSVIVGKVENAFRYIDMAMNLLPAFSHFFSYMLCTQQLALSLTILGDFQSALELYTSLRSKEISTPFSLFIKINLFLLQWLNLECDIDNDNSNAEEIIQRSSNLESIISGFERTKTAPFEVSYRLIELFGIGYENILANILLLNALKIMSTLNYGTLSVTELEVTTSNIRQLCNASLNYLREYLDDDNNDTITDGYVTVRIQALWCKARALHVLFQISGRLDEKTEFKSKILSALQSVDKTISTYLSGIDSFIELTNNYWKLVLVGSDKELLYYVTVRYEKLLHQLDDMSCAYQSPPTINTINRVKNRIKKQQANLHALYDNN